VKNIGHRLFSLGLIAATLCCLDTLDAQTNTVVATPQQLTFNTQPGVATPSQTIQLSTSSGTAASVSVTAYSDSNWLIVAPQSGFTPLLLTVSIGPGAPTSGIDVGFVNVASGTTTLSVPVTLNANSTGVTSPISASPNSLSFVFAANSAAPSSQTVSLSSSTNSVATFTARPITYNGATWLTVSPGSGGLPNDLQVTVNPALLSSPGTFNAAVAISAPGTNGISIPVLVTTQGVPSLNVSPTQLSFGYQLGAALPEAQTLTLSSSTGANVTFTATEADSSQTPSCGNWIALNQSSGATPFTLGVSVNTAGLTAGQCSGQITISAPSASNASVVVPVSLLVSTLPLIQVPVTGPTFTYQIGGATPAAQSVQITSTTPGVNIQVGVGSVNGGPNFLQVTPVSGTTPQSLTLAVNPTVLATLGPGTYTETVTASGGSGAGNTTPPSFDVTLTVSSNPILVSSLQSINFNYQVGQTAPSNQTIAITSSGAPLNYQVAVSTTNCTGFLKATPSSGSTFGSQDQVVVSVNPTGITPQVCNGNVTLTVPGSSASPLVIPVTLNVSNNALLSVSQPAINITVVAGAAATTQTVSVTSTSNTSLAFSAAASTNPTGLTWLSVTPNNGNTPNNLQVTINPANLGVGVYNGSIVVSSPGVPSQTIPVTLTIFASTAVAAPTNLTFTQAAGGTAPESQSVQIAGVPSGTTIGAIATVLSGTGWLTATASGNTVTITANGAQLAQGTYSGVVTVIVPGAGASPLYISVTLNVTTATSAITLSTSSVSFNVSAGSMSIPGTQSVQVTSSASGASVPFTAAFVPSTGGNFLTVTPSSGNTPATIALSVDAAVSSALAAGTYSGDVQVSSGSGAVQTVKVTLVVSPAGTPVVFSINSGASLQPGAVSPGEIVTLFGAGIGPATPATGTSFAPTASGTVPTTLANVTVTFNNVAAPLIFVAPGQINAIVPYEVAGQTSVPVVVTNNGTTSATFTVPVTAVAPSIFSLTENGSGQGAILNSDASINGVSNPAAPGTIISIYATGEGQLVPAGTTGCITGGTLPLPKPVANVSVTIGGEAATSIPYAGEAPDSVCGLIQINATLPADLAAGPQPVVLTIGTASNTGQAITVAVK
jgi:trimeric autotransporter adhesin